MNLKQLRIFIAVYEEGSISAAAERLNATQPGVSQQLKDLEGRLATSLFNRLPSGVEPTPVAKFLYPETVELLRTAKLLEQRAIAFGNSITGNVNVGLMPAFTRSLVAPTIEAFNAQFPDVAVHVLEAYSGVLTSEVEQGNLDFAVVPMAEVPLGVQARHFASDREFLICSSSLERNNLEPVDLRTMSDLKLVLPGAGNQRRQSLDNYFFKNGIEPTAILELDTMMGTLDLIKRGEWMSILPGFLCFQEHADNNRTLHPLQDGGPILDYMLIEPATKPLSPAAEKFVQALEANTGPLAEKISSV